ncbi:unnamed protein product [Dibothriocephalus latus]|uniref:Uncharacterized protein n=1 Tax=Dibothriocephalus latus TaxID=60516 RepID=A0A3P6TDJ2_DIBLA|nr:unnamed protein product [Dibothriocephalus latus]
MTLSAEQDAQDLRTFLLRAEEDKKRLTQRIEKLTANASAVSVQSCEESHENQKLRLERDELQLMLNRLETRVQEARNEIHRLHHDLYDAHNCGDRTSTAQQELLSRLESGNEHAQAEISRLTAERDSVVAKYKKILELENQDKLRHNKQMDYLEKALSEATAERDEVMGRVNGLRRKLEDLQCHQVQIEQRLTEKQEKLKGGAQLPDILMGI